MRRADKIIITCAVTGSIHTPTMSSYSKPDGYGITLPRHSAARFTWT
jgi:hypothetical protein